MAMSGDIMHVKTKEKAEDRRRRICFLDLMGFHLLQDELMVKKNVKSKGKKKSLTDHISVFCWLPSFAFYHQGAFCKPGRKKNHALPDMSYHSAVVRVCVWVCFCTGVFNLKAFTWFEWKFFLYISHFIQFLIFFWAAQAAPSGVFDILTCIDKPALACL